MGCGERIGMPGRETTCGDGGVCSNCWQGPLTVRPQEFVSARDASRGLGKLIDRLEAGEIEKAVIVDRNKPRAVLYAFPLSEADEGSRNE